MSSVCACSRARDLASVIPASDSLGNGPLGIGRLRARCVMLPAGDYLSPGEIVWDRTGRIVALGPTRGPVENLCIVPGLVDAHAHLQLARVEPNRDFVPWAVAVMASRAQQTDEELCSAAQSAALARCAEGVTAVGEIDSTGQSLAALASSGIAGRCYRELTGYHLDAESAQELVAALGGGGTAALAAGLSPHAPYSVSEALFRAAAAASDHLAIHCAETAEEQQFLRDGSGPFADLLSDLGRLPVDASPPGVGAVQWLDQLGVLRENTQLIHCQELERGDAELIANARAPIVVCPGTIAWFRRDPPPVQRWLDAGIVVALGTDSRASNATWSMRAALTQATALWPEFSPQQVLTMATVAGGRALGRATLGTLQVGGRADLLALPGVGDGLPEHLEALVTGASEPEFVLVAGRRVDELHRH